MSTSTRALSNDFKISLGGGQFERGFKQAFLNKIQIES